jgi:hypothetical protein
LSIVPAGAPASRAISHVQAALGVQQQERQRLSAVMGREQKIG